MMEPRKPTTMMMMMRQTRLLAKTKKPRGRTGMQRTTAGSYEQEYLVLTVMEMAKEMTQERRQMTVTLWGGRRGYWPYGRQEANTLSTWKRI